MRNRFEEFMYGRYGSDSLNRFLSIIAIILLLLGIFVRFTLLDLIAVVILVVAYCRMFSRNVARRSEENEKFLSVFSRFTGKGYGGGYGSGYSGYSGGYQRGDYRGRKAGGGRNRKKEWEERKEYRHFSCPHCYQRVRVPRGRGKVLITCPKCRTEFKGKT